MSPVFSSKFRLLAACALLFGGLLHAEVSPKFLNLSVKQGLSQNSVWCIIRDHQGFLWFGTDDGLSKYDGYRFLVYRHRKNDSTSLPQNAIRALVQDRAGRFWIGTSTGLCVYDPVRDTFSPYRSQGEHPSGLQSGSVLSIVEDADGSMWIGTRLDGLYRIDPRTHTHRWFSHDAATPNSLSLNSISSLYIDRAGALWVGTNGGGVNRYERGTGTFTGFKNDPHDPASLIDNTALAFHEDSCGRFWIGTLSHGIAVMDRSTGRCRNYPAGSSMKSAIMDSLTVLTITEDASGRILYGTFGGGVKFLDPKTGTITTWKNDISDERSLAGNEVLALFLDGGDKLWVGTYANGISFHDANGTHFTTYRNEYPHPALFSDNNIRSFYRERNGTIWVGTAKGLDLFDPVSMRCEHYKNIPGDPGSISDNFIRCIVKDAGGTYWIATRNGLNTFDRAAKRFTRWSSGNARVDEMLHTDIRVILEDHTGLLWFGTSVGLCSYDRIHHRYTIYTSTTDPGSISGENVRSLFEDRSGTLWVGTYGAGIDRFHRETGTFTRYVHRDDDPHSLNHINTSPIIEDQDGNLWIGTYGGGINKFDRRTETFSAFTESDGLTNNTIFGLLMDDRGRLWISTFNGVSCFDPKTSQFQNFSSTSGLQSEEFNLNSCFRDKDGTMFFGGHEGFNIFHPDRIIQNTIAPPVYVTSMTVFNKPVRMDSVMTMKQHIVLSHDENSFSFEFVALNYRIPELNRYRYMLEGFDAEWSPVGTERKASYTNLVPGDYVFRVIASNNDDVWNQTGASIRITIHPPFWETWWAYLFYAIGFGALTASAMVYAQRRQRTKLFIERQQFEKERLERVNAEIARERILLRTVIDNLPIAVYAKDADARKVITNSVDLAWINKPESEVLGRTDLDVLRDDSAERSMADDVSVIASGKSIVDREDTVVNAAGERRRMLTTKIPWRDKEGAIIGLVGITQDITDRKRLEQQLLQSQKLEGVGTLAGGIAHDFNNLLAMVLGSAELLQRQLTDQPGLQKFVNRIIEASERGISISRQLLTFSRPDQSELKPVSVSQAISELKEMLKHFLPKSISIVTEADDGNGIIMGDAGQLHQALLNLSLNAGDAMKNTGRLTIREFTASAAFMKQRFSIEHAQPYIAVSVTDTGVGMDEKTRLRIFDPFFTTKAPGKGTGLGLGIVHGIVKHHHGLIAVESVPGEGSTFTLYFPAATHEERALTPAGDSSARNRQGTILVVDDEQLLRDMMCELLSGDGHTVHAAANGADALELFRTHRESIDLVITDLGMPEMGGEELYARLRDIDASVKVMVSSGYLDGTTKEHLLRMGIRQVLIKPFKLDDIQSAIRAMLHDN